MMISEITRKKLDIWLNSNIDEEDKKHLQKLLDENPAIIEEGFHKDLEFGTGGLRGIMGLGTNFVNKYTISIATQGLANYLHQQFPGREKSVAIAYDSRNNSRFFAETVSKVFSANNIKAYLFDSLRPTPELSFAVRYLKCSAGVVITASHNPPEYNGYKVYWNDGAQVVAPHDKNIIEEVKKVETYDNVKITEDEKLIHIIGNEIDEQYIETLTKLTYLPVEQLKKIKAVYTSLHGTGIQIIPKVFQRCGYSLSIVEEQAQANGNFPTVASPNPEESSAMQMAKEQAEREQADVFFGTDPDTDRVGIGIKMPDGKYQLLNGNQAATILVYYNLLQLKQKKALQGNEFIAKTIVTTDLLNQIAQYFDVKCYETLTGFKYIAELIRKFEGQKRFICGGEESYGYLIGDYARDKDAVVSSLFLAEAAEWAHQNNKNLWSLLLDIYEQFGFYYEKLLSITKKGKQGQEEITRMMHRLRKNPPQVLNGKQVTKIIDYQEGAVYENGTVAGKTGLPTSNVLQFITSNGTKVSARPSGTEPKIKFYFSICMPDFQKQNYLQYQKQAEQDIEKIINELSLKS